MIIKVVRMVGFEPTCTRQRFLRPPCIPFHHIRFGAHQEIRTPTEPGLNRIPLPIGVRGQYFMYIRLGVLLLLFPHRFEPDL